MTSVSPVRIPQPIETVYEIDPHDGTIYVVENRGFGLSWSCRSEDGSQKCPVRVYRGVALLQYQAEQRFLRKIGGRIIYGRDHERLVIDRRGRCYGALPSLPATRCPSPLPQEEMLLPGYIPQQEDYHNKKM